MQAFTRIYDSYKRCFFLVGARVQPVDQHHIPAQEGVGYLKEKGIADSIDGERPLVYAGVRRNDPVKSTPLGMCCTCGAPGSWSSRLPLQTDNGKEQGYQ